MATRAELFRYAQERSGPKKPPKAIEKPRRRVGPEDGGTDRVARNESLHAGKRAVFALEDSSGKPSRKSTRKSSNRQKTDVQMRVKRRTQEVRPEARALRVR